MGNSRAVSAPDDLLLWSGTRLPHDIIFSCLYPGRINHLDAGLPPGLPWLLGALAGASLLITIANNIAFFGWMRTDLRPNLKLVSGTVARRIARLGLLFFVLQVVVAIAYSSDNFVVAKLLGPDAVTRYSITAKMFSLISLGLSMFLGPLWPAYGEAASRGGLHWVKRTLVRSTVTAVFIATALSAALVAVGPDILRFWVHRSIAPSFMLLLGLGVWSVMDAAGQSLAIFMNGTNTIVSQLIVATLFAAACLPLKIFLIHRVGVAGVPWATFISYTLLSALPCAFIIPQIVSSLAKRQGENGKLLLPMLQSVPEEGNAIIL